MQSMNKMIGMVVVAVIIAGVSFYGGTVYGQNQAAAARQAAFAGRAGSNFRGGTGGANGGFTTGSIVSMDATSITLSLPNSAGSKIVFFSPSTQISEPQPVDASKLTAGQNVMVAGTTNSDGSITASMIQVRPASTFGGRSATSTRSQAGQ